VYFSVALRKVSPFGYYKATRSLVFVLEIRTLTNRSNAMSAQAPKKPTYTFRAFWALLLLGINVLVAAIYAHIVNI
jgi:hypothetical protein